MKYDWRQLNRLLVVQPKTPEEGSNVTIRESPDGLILRVEEVNTWKALINVKHIKPER